MYRPTNRCPTKRANSTQREDHPNPPPNIPLLAKRRMTQRRPNKPHKRPGRHSVDDDNDDNGCCAGVSGVGPGPGHGASDDGPGDEDVKGPEEAC